VAKGQERRRAKRVKKVGLDALRVRWLRRQIPKPLPAKIPLGKFFPRSVRETYVHPVLNERAKTVGAEKTPAATIENPRRVTVFKRLGPLPETASGSSLVPKASPALKAQRQAALAELQARRAAEELAQREASEARELAYRAERGLIMDPVPVPVVPNPLRVLGVGEDWLCEIHKLKRSPILRRCPWC
jgi:hypothetical protein